MIKDLLVLCRLLRLVVKVPGEFLESLVSLAERLALNDREGKECHKHLVRFLHNEPCNIKTEEKKIRLRLFGDGVVTFLSLTIVCLEDGSNYFQLNMRKFVQHYGPRLVRKKIALSR